MVTTTLTKLRDFLEKECKKYNTYFHGGYRSQFELIIQRMMHNALNQKIFQDHSKTWHIPTETALGFKIIAGNTTPDGAPYNQDYVDWKKEHGEMLPHKLENYSFWHGLSFKTKFRKVILEQHMPYGTNKKFDYVSHHEEQRSVLKASILLAWDKIIDNLVDMYEFMIKEGTSL